jgi:hypothetical protein
MNTSQYYMCIGCQIWNMKQTHGLASLNCTGCYNTHICILLKWFSEEDKYAFEIILLCV